MKRGRKRGGKGGEGREGKRGGEEGNRERITHHVSMM